MEETGLTRQSPLKMAAKSNQFSFQPQSVAELYKYAEIVSKSHLVPQALQGKPSDCMIAIQMGMEVGLTPTQAIQGIAVINGIPSLFGDAALGIVLRSGLVENIKEMQFREIEAAGKAVCWIKRVGIEQPIEREFSIEDAKRMGKWDKPTRTGQQSVWQSHPWRMLQMRARLMALRDGFADVMKGLAIAEEVMDYIDVTPAPETLAPPRRLGETAPPEQPQAPIEPPKSVSEPHQDSAPEETKTETEPTPPDPNDPSATISEAKQHDLVGLAETGGFKPANMKAIIGVFGYKESKEIQNRHYDLICNAIAGKTPKDTEAIIAELTKAK